uniref:G-protein coupled receptors family 1 profile domain-containing protein n=1 Tax=Monopterus albus TaxID=43700 RepID=A0A3Q3IFC8_MONAL
DMTPLSTMSFLRTVLNDSVIIHPPGFYITGFQTLPYISVYVIFLTFIYVVTVLFNSLVICVIAFNHCLHTPKFFSVGNLAVIDVILSTSIISNMIKIYLMKDNFVPFNMCFVQMYGYYTFVTLESYALAILAYDRLIAICFPLHQNSINTLRSMSYIIGLIWCFTLGIMAFGAGIMTRLSFCNSLTVFSYFCDYSAMFRIACNDYTMQWTVGTSITFLILVVPFTFICLSYVSILVTVFRMKSLDSKVKALATCVEHIILVAVFYIPLITIFNIAYYLQLIDEDLSLLSLSLASFTPPCVNPIVYSLKTKEIRNRALALVRKTKISTDQHKKRPWRVIVNISK